MPSGIYKRIKHWKWTEESKEKGNNGWFKKGHKIRLGMKHSKKTRKNIGKAREGQPSPMKGKHHTEKTKQTIKETMTGKHWKVKDTSRMGMGMEGRNHSLNRNPNWKGGKSFEPYSTDWTETLRRSIRERDNYICQLCGKTQIQELEEFERKLPIHHIDYDKKNCDPKNLITLCCKCNSKVNSNRDYWTNYFYKI